MERLETLKRIMASFRSAVLAFSGGVDSTFLAAVAGEVLGNNIILATVASSVYPASELEDAKRAAASMGLAHEIIYLDELHIPELWSNGPDRCYYCKRMIFTQIKEFALRNSCEAVMEGSNADDRKDYRPGRKALEELSIRSPLDEAGFTKEMIRDVSRNMGLPAADKSACACLASRFPYGEKITRAGLRRVERAERELKALGFTQFRVRSHRYMARVEFTEAEIEAGWAARKRIEAICKKAGFIYVAIDTEGYRTGAMNEAMKL
ncbi:MAG: ATP-dependent sacrificial sulfur transferase LarE [bacterium]